MKKFAAVALALIVAMSSMFATVASAADSTEATTLAFAGFEIVDDGVVVDLENMLIYGLEAELHKDNLKNYLVAGNGFSIDEENLDTYLGTGSKIILNDKAGNSYTFNVVIFGDINGDSVYDVLDAARMHNVVNDLDVVEETCELLAVDTNKDGELSVDDYAQQVNAIKNPDVVDQNANGTETDGVLDIASQVYVSDNTSEYTLPEEDVTLTFNDVVIDTNHYDIGECEYKIADDGTIYGEVTITGKGLFSGEIKVKVEVVSLLEKIVATVNDVIADAALTDVVNVVKDGNDVNVVIDAGTVISGDFAADINGLNGLLAKIDDFRAKNLQEVSLVVEDYALASNGAFNRSEIKALGFDLVSGIFTAIANAENNVIKSYSGVLNTNADVAEDFTINFVMDGTGREIDKVKNFAAKIANFVSFDVVDGNAVIDITMPAGFATKVVDIVGGGDVETAIENVNTLNVYRLLGEYVRELTVDDISASSAAEINQVIEVVSGLDTVVDKVLSEVTTATVTDVNGNAYELLNGGSFYIEESDNKIAALVDSVGRVLTEEILLANVGAFYKDGIYTVEADVAIDYKNISEKVIVNFDLFGAAETPAIIEETATYFSDIIDTLGLANVAAVSYDADNCRALATLNARELATNLTLNEEAFDGLYTDIKGYFDETYGTATIVVAGYEVVTDGSINKTALKNLIFSVATGFFQDAANLGENNVLRSLNTVVTEADGTVHNFDLDFALAGEVEDIERVASIAAKVAEYVSFEVVNGNAVVNIGVPAGMRAKIVDLLGAGDAAEAQAELNKLSVYRLLDEFVRHVSPEDISAANATEIQAIIDMVASVDSLVNKVLGKVTTATVDVNGTAVNLLSGKDFVVEEASVDGLVTAFGYVLSEDVLLTNISEFMNEDGVYEFVIDAGVSVGGIQETITVNIDIF